MKQSADTRKPYTGSTRSLVIALDVGTTFSGVSYAILEPGFVPKIHGVTRFPGQEHVAGNSKIPSVLYYDKSGNMMAAGAEADTTSVLAQAEDDEWSKTELFKLRLRPRTMKLNMNGMRLGPLPHRKNAVHVFGDFLSYLYQCTRTFIMDTHANGTALWKAVEHNIQFVLSHPNGWEGAQQTKMRRAAVYGGLIPDSNEGRARIRFVTEGEASLHACVLNGLASDVLSNEQKSGFLVADAGGGTLDISSYMIIAQHPLVIEEVAPPDCIFAGSVFVSRRAREFLKEKLKNSKYGSSDTLDHITKRFDETTKRLFRNTVDTQFIGFGSPLDKDLSVGIRSGQLKLTGAEVAELFEPSIKAAVTAIKAQIDASKGAIKSVFLVGGYAASPWLFSQLQERLAKYHVAVSRPDTQTSKAVADGAIGFYCDHHVSARVAKFMYGVEYLRAYDANDPDHVIRKERLTELPSGPKLLADAFDCILARGTKVKESTVFTRKYCTELTNLSMLSVFEVEIWCFRGGDKIPLWIERQAENFSTLCLVRADLSPLSGIVETKIGRDGRSYWTIIFSIEIHFGLTEFKARIKWVDNGVVKYGPASIIYNERGHRVEEDEPDLNSDDDLNVESRSRSIRGSRTPSIDTRRPPESVIHPSSLRAEKSPKIPDVLHAPTSGFQTPFSQPEQQSRGLENRGSVSSRGRAKDKGKEKERAIPEGISTRSSSFGQIGETLSSVWGAGGEESPTKSPSTAREGRSRLGSVAEDPLAHDAAAASPPPVSPPPPIEVSRSLGLSPSLSKRSASVKSAVPSATQSVASASKISSPTPAPPVSEPANAPVVESVIRSPVISPLSPSMPGGGLGTFGTTVEPEKPTENSSMFGGGSSFLSSFAAPAMTAAETAGSGLFSSMWGSVSKNKPTIPKSTETSKAPTAPKDTSPKAASPRASSPKPATHKDEPELAATTPDPASPLRPISPSIPPAESNSPARSALATKTGTPKQTALSLDEAPKLSAIPRSIAGTPGKLSPKPPSSPLSRSTFPSPKAVSSPLTQESTETTSSTVENPWATEFSAPAETSEPDPPAPPEPAAEPEYMFSSKKSSRKSTLKQAAKKEKDSTPLIAATVELPASSKVSPLPSPKPPAGDLLSVTGASAANQVDVTTAPSSKAAPVDLAVASPVAVAAAPSPKVATTEVAELSKSPKVEATSTESATLDAAGETKTHDAPKIDAPSNTLETKADNAAGETKTRDASSNTLETKADNTASETTESKALSPLKLDTDLPSEDNPASSVPLTAVTTTAEGETEGEEKKDEENKEEGEDNWFNTKKGKKKGKNANAGTTAAGGETDTGGAAKAKKKKGKK